MGDVTNKAGIGDVMNKAGMGDVMNKAEIGDVMNKAGIGDIMNKAGLGDIMNKAGSLAPIPLLGDKNDADTDRNGYIALLFAAAVPYPGKAIQ